MDSFKSTVTASLISIVFLGFMDLTAIPAFSQTKPNILLFLADDLGWGDAPSYNRDSRIPMPHFDKLAEEGMRFTDAHSPTAICAPSRYGLLTGNYQWRGLYPGGQWEFKGGSQILENQWTIADILKEQGYNTAMFGKLHLGGDFYLKNSNAFAASNTGETRIDFDRGLQNGPLTYGFNYSYPLLRGIQTSPYAYFENDRLVGNPVDLLIWSSGTYGNSVIPYDGIGMPYWNTSEIGPHLAQKAVDFIDRHHRNNLQNGGDTPFFIYYASQSAHRPWTPPDTFNGEPIRDVTGMTPHTDMVHEIDAALGMLIHAIEDRGLGQNTLILFTSDNGGIPDETSYGHDAVGGLRGQKWDIWEGGHRVPFVAKWGDGTLEGSVIRPGAVSGQLISIHDVVATLAAVVERDLPITQARDSFNFLPVLVGDQNEDNPVRDHLILQNFVWESNAAMPSHYALRMGKWKLILDVNYNIEGLFNLEDDLVLVRK